MTFGSALLVCVAVVCLGLGSGGRAEGQHPRRETLTPAEVEQVREAAIVPVERVKLYIKFLKDRTDRIKDLTGRPRSAARAEKLDQLLQDVSSLMDEISGNLDVYSERRSDIRKALKLLSEDAPRWVTIVRALPGEQAFDISRKDAIESGEELADEATRILHEQENYFAEHKDERGQEREDASKEANKEAKDPAPPQEH